MYKKYAREEKIWRADHSTSGSILILRRSHDVISSPPPYYSPILFLRKVACPACRPFTMPEVYMYSHIHDSTLSQPFFTLVGIFHVEKNLSIRSHLRFYSNRVLSLPTSRPSTKSYRGSDRCYQCSTGRKRS